jgi:hypothetical protein
MTDRFKESREALVRKDTAALVTFPMRPALTSVSLSTGPKWTIRWEDALDDSRFRNTWRKVMLGARCDCVARRTIAPLSFSHELLCSRRSGPYTLPPAVLLSPSVEDAGSKADRHDIGGGYRGTKLPRII